MDMHQGQMCRIQRRSDGADMGFYLRLRSSDGQQRYYRVQGSDDPNDLQRSGDPIAFSDVDVKANNTGGRAPSGWSELSARPYVVTCIVPTEIQAKVMMFNPDVNVAEEVFRNAVRANIDREIEKAQSGLVLAESEIENYRRAKARLEVLKKDADDLIAKADDVDRGIIPAFVYAYGKHQITNKEFCWRVPKSLEDRVATGMSAIADTAYGLKVVTITRIEKLQRLLPHRILIELCEPVSEGDLS